MCRPIPLSDISWSQLTVWEHFYLHCRVLFLLSPSSLLTLYTGLIFFPLYLALTLFALFWAGLLPLQTLY